MIKIEDGGWEVQGGGPPTIESPVNPSQVPILREFQWAYIITDTIVSQEWDGEKGLIINKAGAKTDYNRPLHKTLQVPMVGFL